MSHSGSVAVAPASGPGGASLGGAGPGPAAVTADSVTTVSGLALTAVVIVAIILLLVYRSPVLWLLPLAGSIGAIVVAEAAAHGLAAVGFTVTPLTSSILIVLVFGAASDYALLLIHRYREELRHGPAEDAMAAALRATLPTLGASAATVTGAMFCLLAAQSASLHGLGPLGAVAIVSALLAQATFLPALLLVAGRCAFWPRISRPGETRTEESRLWSGIGRRIAGHPRPVAAVGLLLLALGCLGLLTAQTTNNPFSDIKGRPGSVVGAQLLAAHYPAGTIAPLDLLAEPGHAAAAAAITQATPGVASVTAGAAGAGFGRFPGAP